LSKALLEARVAVYPVGGRPPNGRIGVGNNEGGAMPGGPFVAPEHIGAFADITGGRTYAAAEIHDGIADAIRDSKSTYRVAYLPPQQNWDGKRHKIAIAPLRGGVHLLAPRWYLAGRLEDVAAEQRPPIPDSAIAGPFEQSDLAVSVSPPEKLEKALRIEIHVDAKGLLLLQRNGRYAGSVALQALCYSSGDRRMACTEPMLVKLDLSPQEHTAALRGGLRFPLDIPMAATPNRMRVVACDQYTRACGTATFPLPEER
jgi:hypothetical protein